MKREKGIGSREWGRNGNEGMMSGDLVALTFIPSFLSDPCMRRSHDNG